METDWQARARAWQPSRRVFLPSGRALERTGLSEEGRGPGPLEGFPAICRAPRPGALSPDLCRAMAKLRLGQGAGPPTQTLTGSHWDSVGW